MQAAIEINGLTKVYGYGDDALEAVAQLDLVVGQGEVFGFLGPNGSGKTTTVEMLMGVIFPTSGSARLLGEPLGNLSARSRTGYLPETFRFHSYLRADEFLDFHARLYGMPSSRRRKRVPEVLEIVGLTGSARSRIRTFSKGMLQRIGIAQAIINEPDLLFLDEPTSALDPMGRRDVRELLVGLRDRGTTIFMNSHLLSEVEMICARVGIMSKGKLSQSDNLESLLKPAHCVEVCVEGMSESAMTAIRRLAVRVDVEQDHQLTVTLDHEDKISELADIIIRGGGNLKQFTPRQQPLEEAFIEAVEGRKS